jgi:nucleotide-binding universal stress UspA family protein
MMMPDVFPIPASVPSKPGQSLSPADGEDELTYTRILVPIDFSEYSKQSTSYAARFASRYNATLLLVHVFESGYAMTGDEGSKPRSELLKSQAAAAEEAAQANLAVIENQLRNRGIKTEAHHRSGCPFDEIVKIANLLNIDLIIIGSHGRTGLLHLLLGSVAERVVEHAQCPVLVLKQRRR